MHAETTTPPSKSGIKPDFLVIGAAKSGTTSLCALLDQHPEVYVSDPKEPRFFSFDSNYAKGWDWYARFFANAGKARAVGEGSANYTMLPVFPRAASRIAQHLPQAKLIYIVRHPVERILSTWRMLARRQWEVAHFSNSVRDPQLRQYFVDRSRYWYQIQAYREHFDDSQIQVVFFEDFKAKPRLIVKELYEFLGVDPDKKLEDVGRAHNASRDYRADQAWMRSLRDRSLVKLLRKAVPKPARRIIRQWVTHPIHDKPDCDRETLEWLVEELREDVQTFLSFYKKPENYWTLRTSELAKLF